MEHLSSRTLITTPREPVPLPAANPASAEPITTKTVGFLACATLLLAVLVAAPALAEDEEPWSGSLGLSYAWQSVSGNEDSFLTQYNLREGVNLEELSLAWDGEGPEKFFLDAHGFGGAWPTRNARMGFQFRGGIGVFLDYDRRNSFFALDDRELGSRTDDWSIVRWKARVKIDTLKPVRFEVGFRSYETTGTVTRPTFQLNALWPIGINLDEGMQEASVRLETRTLPVHIEFEQALTRYENKNTRFAAGEEALGAPNPNILVESLTLTDDTQDVPTTRFNIGYGNPWFEALGTVLYSDAELSANGPRTNLFGIGGGAIGTVRYLENLIGEAQAESLFAAANIGVRFASNWFVRADLQTRDATTDSNLLGRRLIRGNSPLGSPVVFYTPVDEVNRYESKDDEARLRLEYRGANWSIWGGGMWNRRDVAWEQSAGGDRPETRRSTDGFLAGLTVTPGRWLDLHLEYEEGDFTGYVFRTDPKAVSRTTFKLRSQIGGGWHVAANARIEEGDNPTEVAGMDHRATPYGVSAGWRSSSGESNAGFDVQRIQLETDTGIVLPTGEDARSFYDLDLVSATAYGETRAGIVHFRGSATFVEDNGSTWPLNSWTANARISFRGPGGLDYGVFLEYWSYDEGRADFEDYDVTRGGVSLLWRFQ